ncbi:MAG: twin-arginine translocase TatA/TatE family subunit [Terracidiphilus sp.]
MVNPPPIELGTLGMSDTLILMILALVVFGPRRLPQIGRQIGKLMYEFRKASNDFKFQMEEELRLSEDADRRKKEEAERSQRLALNPPAQTVESQGAIGAQESVSAPSHPLYGSGYPEPYPPDTASIPAEDAPVTMPRIQPPSTGAPVPAKQGSGIRDQGSEEQGPRDQGTKGPETQGPSTLAAEEAIVAEANIGAGAAAPVNETAASAQTEDEPHSESTQTETVNQHG